MCLFTRGETDRVKRREKRNVVQSVLKRDEKGDKKWEKRRKKERETTYCEASLSSFSEGVLSCSAAQDLNITSCCVLD